MYDGFALFHQFHIEGLGYRGMKFGEALDFYQGDIGIDGPNPILPSGGNIGCGRGEGGMPSPPGAVAGRSPTRLRRSFAGTGAAVYQR